MLDKEKVAAFGVDRAPAIAIVGSQDLGLRYYGVPAGYELASLADAILLVASGDPGFAPDSLVTIGTVDRPVHLKVFVTPT